MKNAIELLQAELSAALALNAKLAARIEALEKAGNYQAVNESPISLAEYAALSYRDSGYGLGDDDRAEMEIIDADEQERIEIELNAGEWVPDIQWHKDNGYQL